MLPAHASGKNYAKLSHQGLVGLELKFGIDSREGGRAAIASCSKNVVVKKLPGTAVVETQVAVGEHGSQQRAVKSDLPPDGRMLGALNTLGRGRFHLVSKENRNSVSAWVAGARAKRPGPSEFSY